MAFGMFGNALWMILMTMVVHSKCSIEERYDLRHLPPDLKPIVNLIGLWELESKGGSRDTIRPSDLIDVAINPIPKFGARAANFTHTYLDDNNNVIRFDYGFMPVKNATKRDRRIHIAHLTTSSEGFSMMEQGIVNGNIITFHLKQFLRRSFSVGNSGDLEILELERRFEIVNPRRMIMKLRYQTTAGISGFTAIYRKIMP